MSNEVLQKSMYDDYISALAFSELHLNKLDKPYTDHLQSTNAYIKKYPVLNDYRRPYKLQEILNASSNDYVFLHERKEDICATCRDTTYIRYTYKFVKVETKKNKHNFTGKIIKWTVCKTNLTSRISNVDEESFIPNLIMLDVIEKHPRLMPQIGTKYGWPFIIKHYKDRVVQECEYNYHFLDEGLPNFPTVLVRLVFEYFTLL
jgi:hypothetical protein